MKCDELQRYSLYIDHKKQAFAVPDDDGTYMDSSEVDAAIAELKAENERLNNALDKERSETIKYMDELCNAKNEIERLTIDKRNDELRADVADGTVEKLKAENAELNAENERLKEMIPKYKKFIEEEEFRKKLVDEYDGYVYDWKGRHYVATPYLNIFVKGILRALWLARAKRAEARKNYWYVRSIHEGDKNLWSIDGSAVKYIGCIKRTNFDWLKIWSEVERKCRAKAEEYK